MTAPPAVRRILSPTQLNALARSLLEDSFPLVEVEGEISNLARPASGHLYCTLKDRNAQVRCALFKPKSQWLRFKPADGMQVIGRGRLTLYEPRGDYQLLLEHLEPAGEGALQRAFEELKSRLLAEGLFDSARKRALPARIGRVAVLTSPSGAAIHDVLTVIARRFPLLQVDLVPVPVQGSDAAARIVAAMGAVNAAARHDVILLTRGGGSLEDLACFNDEALARAIVASRIPVVCAVGHEVDTSIADFAADLRCPTPSAAAETLTPDRLTLLSRVHTAGQRMRRSIATSRQRAAQSLDHLQTRLATQQPRARLRLASERACELARRLQQGQKNRLAASSERVRHASLRLRPQHPALQLAGKSERLQRARLSLQAQLGIRLQAAAWRVAHVVRALEATSPLATVARGYAILNDQRGVLRSVAAVQAGDSISARLHDGVLRMTVLAVQPSIEPVSPEHRSHRD